MLMGLLKRLGYTFEPRTMMVREESDLDLDSEQEHEQEKE